MTEASIAARFGVSRTPAREALHRLRSDGLMRGYVRGGWKVVPIDFKRFEDLYEIRKLIETFRHGTNAIAQETAQHLPNVVGESAYGLKSFTKTAPACSGSTTPTSNDYRSCISLVTKCDGERPSGPVGPKNQGIHQSKPNQIGNRDALHGRTSIFCRYL
ncbi:hypothetical protein OKW46_006912 [Paraburkholderia sp. WSM4179]|nr:hypothetical protein [Paraburkholderia sp. WSM4179]